MGASSGRDDGHAEPGMVLETRERFQSQLGSAADQVAQGVPHALLVVKVERVTDVARECGSDAEHALIAIVCARLFDQVGTRAVAARIGDDRFVILRPHCLPRDALALGRRVRVALEGGQFVWKGLSFRLGANVGVLELADTAVAPGDQIAHAERACSAASALGGDGVVLSTGRADYEAMLEAEEEWREHLREVI